MSVNIAILLTIIGGLLYVIVTIRPGSAKKKTALSNLEKVSERCRRQALEDHGLAHPEAAHDRGPE